MGVTLRTKLTLLLCTALVIIMSASTYLRMRWTRAQLERQLFETAQNTAELIASDLSRRLTAGQDGDDVAEQLAKVKLRYPVVADIQLTFDTDEETTSTFSLPSNTDETQVARRPRAARLRNASLRREDARRALMDHGDYFRPPGWRVTEPLWRTPDRLDPPAWPEWTQQKQTPRISRTYHHGDRGEVPVYEVRLPVDSDGPKHGDLTISVTREPIEHLLRTETWVSGLITGGAVLLLVLMTVFMIDRVVAQPVSELEQAMKRVEQGVLDAKVETHENDEIGHLSRGFNAMVVRLAQADSDIRAFNRRLADEVKDATQDLAKKNQALEDLNRLLFDARREIGDKERLAALGQLAAQLAHEIGTPLSSISGHLQLAQSAHDVPASIADRLGVASQELERISKIVRDYLDSTRRVEPEFAMTEIGRVVLEAVGILRGDGRRNHVPIQVDISSSATIRTDPGLVRQILVNLLSNAADAVLQAPAGEIRVRSSVNNGQLELSVEDDGAGINAEDAARIFEPFYTTKGRGKGTGLGLAICRELASALGGKIVVDSVVGHGSVFRLILPQNDMPERQAS